MPLHRSRMLLALGGALAMLGCVADPPLGPPGENVTGPVTSGSGAGRTTEGSDEDTAEETAEGDTGTPGDLPGCDPVVDPVLECGPQMTCDLTSRVCVPALGTGLEGEPCLDADGCSPGLICELGRCRRPCDATLGQGCDLDQVCSLGEDPIPGLCMWTCDLVLDECTEPGEACKRVYGANEQVWAACVDNPGAGLTGDACELDTDCAPGHLCTPAEFHTLPCADDAPSCCAPVCDQVELPCLGLEPVCYLLPIPGQETAGFCGVG